MSYEVPSGYPADLDVDVALRDGAVVRVRPIMPSDTGALRDFFGRLGPESRYFRFFRVKLELTEEELEYFTTVDYSRRMALVAQTRDSIVGVGRYDRLEDAPAVAEVAFAVADDYQGNGIGTQLLQLLTAHARSNEISAFRAHVLSENVQMMRVFRNSGYELRRTIEDGVFTVDFPVARTTGSMAASEEREQRAVAASVLPLFFPRSVAVIGASTRPGSIGSRLFKNLLDEQLAGPVYPVNPNTQVVHSVKAYQSVKDIPDTVDLAFIVVPAPLVLGVVEECAEKGVRGLVVISAGFSEIGAAGVEAERELLDVVRRSNMRMVGPNCMGLLNTAPSVRLNGTFAPVFPPPGNVAMSSQSGALGISILDFATRSRIGISQFVSVGNKADVSANDLLLAWERDPSTDVIVLYLESFGNPRRFARLARRIAREKPILAVKSGRTAAGSRAASSHTGALATLDIAVDALFRQSGVIRTNTLEDLFAVASLLANQPVPGGRRVGIVTNAGGPAILAADALSANGMELPEFSSDLRLRLAAVLAAESSTVNPVDLIASGGPAEYRHAISEVLASGEVDALLVIYVPASPDGAEGVAEVLRQFAAEQSGDVSLLSVFMQASQGPPDLSSDSRTIPAYRFPEQAALALAKATTYGEWLAQPAGEVPEFGDIDVSRARATVESALARLGSLGGWLDPEEVEDMLQAAGIRSPWSAVAGSAKEAAALAATLEGPVALKVLSPSALHKSDVGGVELGLRGANQVMEGYTRVTAVVPDPEGVLVQEMVPGGIEILIGVTEDASFGSLIGFGMGGVLVELLGDVSFRISPITDVDADEMIREIRTAPVLDGYRGEPAGDIPAIRETLLRVSTLTVACPEIREMDLNPVKVLRPGEGAVVLDARIRAQPVSDDWVPEIEDFPATVTRRSTG